MRALPLLSVPFTIRHRKAGIQGERAAYPVESWRRLAYIKKDCRIPAVYSGSNGRSREKHPSFTAAGRTDPLGDPVRVRAGKCAHHPQGPCPRGGAARCGIGGRGGGRRARLFLVGASVRRDRAGLRPRPADRVERESRQIDRRPDRRRPDGKGDRRRSCRRGGGGAARRPREGLGKPRGISRQRQARRDGQGGRGVGGDAEGPGGLPGRSGGMDRQGLLLLYGRLPLRYPVRGLRHAQCRGQCRRRRGGAPPAGGRGRLRSEISIRMGLLITERLEDVSTAEWDDVLARSLRPSPFLSRRFLIPWTKAFAAGRPLRVARWEREERAEGFLFLCRGAADDGWELLGGEEVSDSLDAVVAAGLEGAFWSDVLGSPREMLAEGPIRMPNLVEGAPSLSVLPGICRERGVAFAVEETDRSPVIPRPESFENYIERLGKKERHELRRKLRRAGESDPRLSFRVTGTAEELTRDFPSFLELHRGSHPEKERFMDDRMAAFFREVAEGFLSAGLLRLAFLRGAEGDIASAFQIEHDGALLLYNSGFDSAAGARLSPGMVLLARCIEDAIRTGFQEYDFLRGRERYKYDLGGRDRLVYRAV